MRSGLLAGIMAGGRTRRQKQAGRFANACIGFFGGGTEGEAMGKMVRNILIAASVLGLAGMIVFAIRGLPARRPAPVRWESAEAMRRGVAGKTPDEVKAAIGPPDYSRGDAWKGERAAWFYRDALRNKATEKPEPAAVEFAHGFAVGVIAE